MPGKQTTVWLSRSSLQELLSEADAKSPRETGGILIGYWASEIEAVVTQLVGPGSRAKHSTKRFVPDALYHEQETTRLYEASGRLDGYLGDWHSHPLSFAYLSRADRKTLRGIAEDKGSRNPTPLMLIYGGEDGILRAWRYVPVMGTNLAQLKGVSVCGLKIYGE